jgi:hypothetical protein
VRRTICPYCLCLSEPSFGDDHLTGDYLNAARSVTQRYQTCAQNRVRGSQGIFKVRSSPKIPVRPITARSKNKSPSRYAGGRRQGRRRRLSQGGATGGRRYQPHCSWLLPRRPPPGSSFGSSLSRSPSLTVLASPSGPCTGVRPNHLRLSAVTRAARALLAPQRRQPSCFCMGRARPFHRQSFAASRAVKGSLGKVVPS